MSINSSWVPPRLPTQPAGPAPLPAPPGSLPRQSPAQAPAAADRGMRQSGQAARGSNHASSTGAASREAQLTEARSGISDKGEVSSEALEAGRGDGGLAPVFGRVEGRSAPSRDGRRDQSGVPTQGPAKPENDETIRPTDVVGLFTTPGRGGNTDEEAVKHLVRELEKVQNNRLKRKIEVIVTMARAGSRQDRSQMAICEEAMRDVDTQFDELERQLGLRIREAKQAVAARQVSAGATASYLLIAADQHDRRMLRQRLERQREQLRQVIIRASSATSALNATPLIAMLQALQTQVESEITAAGTDPQSRSERMSADQLKEIETRRTQALRIIGDAWRKAGETPSGLVGVFTEVRQSVEQRFEQQREQVIDA